MKYFSLILSMIFLVLPYSCKKENKNPSDDLNKLKYYIFDSRGPSSNMLDTVNYSYDPQNRITLIAYTGSKNVYTYTNSNNFLVDIYQSGILWSHEMNFLNNSLLVDSIIEVGQNGDTVTVGYTYGGTLLNNKRAYNYSQSAGPQIYFEEDYSYDANGNLIKIITSDGKGNVNFIDKYTYTDYIPNLTLDPTYYPTQSHNLLATIVKTDGSYNFLESESFSYVFDSSKRLVKETSQSSTGQTTVFTYVYL